MNFARTFRNDSCELIAPRTSDRVQMTVNGSSGTVTLYRQVDGNHVPILNSPMDGCETTMQRVNVPASEILIVCAVGVSGGNCVTVAIDQLN